MIDTFPAVEVCRVWIIICGAEQLNGALRIEGKEGEISPQWYSTMIPDSIRDYIVRGIHLGDYWKNVCTHGRK